MNEQSDDDKLNDLPSLAASSEDMHGRPRNSGRRSKSGAGGSGGASGGWFTNLLIAVLIAGLTACGWFLVAQNETLVAVNSTLADLDDRLVRIEDRLQMTDRALSETESETQDQLAYWESEIRKLWDVSNKRNRGWIEDNQEALAALQKSMASQGETLQELEQQAQALQEGLATQSEMATRLQRIDQRTSDLVKEQRGLADRVNTLTSEQRALGRRTESLEEAAAAVDSFRRDMVGRVARLQRRLEALAGDGDAPQTLQPDL